MIVKRFKVWVLLGVFLTGTFSVAVFPEYQLSDFSGSSSVGVGYVSVGSRPFFKSALYPELEFGPVSAGFDVNVYVPLDGKPSPSDLHSFAFRKLAYTATDWGLSWGRITNQTFGNGLLMDDYDSGAGGSIEFDSSKAGVRYYSQSDSRKSEVIWTAKNVIGSRLQYQFQQVNLLGRPIWWGLSVISDSDGVYGLDGTQIRPRTIGYSGDASVPILDSVLVGYVEVASLYFPSPTLGESDRHGSGAGIGLSGKPAPWVNYRLEYRDLGSQFVPGYYGPTYEATGFDFASDSVHKRISGVVGSVNAEMFDGYFKGQVRYESYSDPGYDPVLSGSLGWKEIARTVGVFNFTQRFDRESRPIAALDVLYKTGGLLDYVVHIKRVYTNFSKGLYEQSFSVEARADLNSLVPGIPFVK